MKSTPVALALSTLLKKLKTEENSEQITRKIIAIKQKQITKKYKRTFKTLK